jgi:hypothetical protein
MKKIVAAFLAGAILMFSGQALADTISNVGKKIKAEYTVTVDGEALNEKAIAVDGLTYTPNGVLAAAIGYDVKFENKKVIYKKKQVIPASQEPGGETVSITPIIVESATNTTDNDAKIRGLEYQLQAAKRTLESFKGSLDNPTITEEQRALALNKIAEMEAKINGIKEETASLKVQPTPTP